MSELVYRIATALLNQDVGGGPEVWDNAGFTSSAKAAYRAKAVAAIEAIEAAGYRIVKDSDQDEYLIGSKPGPVFSTAEVKTTSVPLDGLYVDIVTPEPPEPIDRGSLLFPKPLVWPDPVRPGRWPWAITIRTK